jgi:hypothetical protein
MSEKLIDYRATIDSLRAKIEALERENVLYRTIPYDQDGTPFAAASAWRTECSRVHAQLAAMKQERDDAVDKREGAYMRLDGMRQERDRLKEAVLWALGYTDFRPRRADEGFYWWRKELRTRALPEGISEADIQAYQAKALRGETGGG